ncbi:hypothetical protein QVD17_10626 [Tagetes erecta]|uniref:Uncharacterized protein n=1 Tax=Tagetes erecta TaxID=13708 RepID=A0AAD8P6G6_TARER|nr:hypothetical protein QVD17_10626 [Tagetes erecta]
MIWSIYICPLCATVQHISQQYHSPLEQTIHLCYAIFTSVNLSTRSWRFNSAATPQPLGCNHLIRLHYMKIARLD